MRSNRRNHPLLLAALSICLAIVVPTAFAEDELQNLLIHAPANNQGMVTRQSYLKQAAAAFDAMDKDKKARINSRSEMSDRNLQNILVHAGPDSEGNVSKTAYMKHMGAMWDKADRARRGMMAEDSYRKFVEELSKR